jgi:hypothetical protein
LGKIKQPYVTIENVSVLKQNYIVSDQKELLPPPPPAYSLWNASLGCVLPLGKNNLDINFPWTTLPTRSIAITSTNSGILLMT